MWGLDLSGSTTGAGGVGGLLTVRSVANGVHFVGYDGNGNVVALAKGSDGTVGARYEYDAFGNMIRKSGTAIAHDNPWEISTKRRDKLTGTTIFETRQLHLFVGKWLSRDSIGELGNANIYGFISNDPVNSVDVIGMIGYSPSVPYVPPPSIPPPALKRVPPLHGLGCCDDNRIEEGASMLKARYAAVITVMNTRFKPAETGEKGATCKTSTSDIIEWLLPTPNCWACYLELRHKFNNWFHGKVPYADVDHQVIVC
jgi:RHS repeat-associated protein